MKKKAFAIAAASLMLLSMLTGCGGQTESQTAVGSAQLSDDATKNIKESTKMLAEVSQVNFQVEEVYEGNYYVNACCEITNTGDVPIEITEVTYTCYDKEGISLGSNNWGDTAPYILNPGEIALSSNYISSTSITSPDETADVQVEFQYGDASGYNGVTDQLEVSGESLVEVNGNPIHKGIECVVTNSFNLDVLYYTLNIGLYDDQGKLLAVVNSTDQPGIKSGESLRATASQWLSKETAPWDSASKYVARACVRKFNE